MSAQIGSERANCYCDGYRQTTREGGIGAILSLFRLDGTPPALFSVNLLVDSDGLLVNITSNKNASERKSGEDHADHQMEFVALRVFAAIGGLK